MGAPLTDIFPSNVSHQLPYVVWNQNPFSNNQIQHCMKLVILLRISQVFRNNAGAHQEGENLEKLVLVTTYSQTGK